MKAEHFLERMTWPEVEAQLSAGIDAVLLPIGTTEQHGRHMPLDTDCVIARGLAARAAEAGEAAGVRLLVAPTLNVTLSWYHMQFPGSLRLSTTTFLEVFRDVCDSLAAHGLERLIAVNGHGGNAAALTVAVNHGQYGMRHAGPKVVVPMDMLRDITASGVVGDATRATVETGERIVAAVVPRIVQVARELSGKEM